VLLAGPAVQEFGTLRPQNNSAVHFTDDRMRKVKRAHQFCGLLLGKLPVRDVVHDLRESDQITGSAADGRDRSSC
jgi:hypothetical protein